MIQNYHKYLKRVSQIQSSFNGCDIFFVSSSNFFFFIIEVVQAWVATTQLKDAAHACEN